MKTAIEHIAFPTRAARSEYVARRFQPYFGGKLLDVGCYEAPLRKILSGLDYTGVDFVGTPDIELNLEQCGGLPFEDSSFDCVLCIDVLEHLENLHFIFDELIRVSRGHVIVSLPNCWRDARRPIERGRGDFVHYGLPAEKPLDRHKWFFNFSQAAAFMRAKAAAHAVELRELFGTEKPKNPLARTLRRLRYSEEPYNNRYVQTVWAVFSKTGSAP
jgi:ubiquinone/menaquinone biosynthesis C-methylase UbiE